MEENKKHWPEEDSSVINVPNDTDEETPVTDQSQQEWFSNNNQDSTKFQPFDEIQINSKPQPSVPLNILEEGINSNYGFVAKTVSKN